MYDTRNIELQQLVTALESNRTRALDVVAHGSSLRSNGGFIELAGVDPVVTDDGVTTVDGQYRPNVVGDEGLAAKLDIPIGYLSRLHTSHTELYDANVNGWLERSTSKYLLRLLASDDGSTGIMRAFLSDGYRTIDNIDVVLAVLAGIQQAGHSGNDLTINADLTDRRMYLRVTSKTIAANVTDLVRHYRAPGEQERYGAHYPLMFAGFVVSNSEVGNGAFSIVPRTVLQVCTNGQTIQRDAARTVHLGAKLQEGVVRWSADTQRKNLELITAKAKDAVATFLSKDYVERIGRELSEAAGVKVTDPVKTIQGVSQTCGFTKAQQASILTAFIDGGDTTATGIMHAVTWVAQQAESGDDAAALEAQALPALQRALVLAK